MKIKNCRIKNDKLIFNLGYTSSLAAVLYITCILFYALIPILLVFLINSYSDYLLIALLSCLSLIIVSHLLLFLIRKMGYQIILRINKSEKDNKLSAFSIYNKKKIIFSGNISKNNFYIQETNSKSNLGMIPRIIFNLIFKIDNIPAEIYKLRPEGLVLSRWDVSSRAEKEKFSICSFLSL